MRLNHSRSDIQNLRTHVFTFAFRSLPLQSAPFHHSSLQLTVQFASPVFSRHLTISPDDSLIDPVTTSYLLLACNPLHRALPPWFPIGAAWAPRIVHSGLYFNINFPDGDTSFASALPRISPEPHHHPHPLFVPPRCRARARTKFFSFLRSATDAFSKKFEANKFWRGFSKA